MITWKEFTFRILIFDSVKSVVVCVKEATFFRKQILKNSFILKLICSKLQVVKPLIELLCK